MTRLRRVQHSRERGNAIVEFTLLATLMLVPLVYVLLSALEVQRTAYGVTQAAREAGRVYAIEGDQERAHQAAQVALADQAVPLQATQVRLTCDADPCYRPGNRFEVTVDATVALPLLPQAFADYVNARVPVRATHVAVVDAYRDLDA